MGKGRQKLQFEAFTSTCRDDEVFLEFRFQIPRRWSQRRGSGGRRGIAGEVVGKGRQKRQCISSISLPVFFFCLRLVWIFVRLGSLLKSTNLGLLA